MRTPLRIKEGTINNFSWNMTKERVSMAKDILLGDFQATQSLGGEQPVKDLP